MAASAAAAVREEVSSEKGHRYIMFTKLLRITPTLAQLVERRTLERILGYGAQELEGQIIRYALSVINMFFFAFMVKATRGGAYNPLSLLSSALSGNFSDFLFTLGARLPAQVVGAIYGVSLILDTFPGIGRGPRLNVGVTMGALTEGLLTFCVVFISLGLASKVKDSFFMNTWISSLSKLTLHTLGSDLTGGCMNPASVMGWAFANGEHITKEHWVVYWLAPVQASFLAVWTFRLLFRAKSDEGKSAAAKKGD